MGRPETAPRSPLQRWPAAAAPPPPGPFGGAFQEEWPGALQSSERPTGSVGCGQGARWEQGEARRGWATHLNAPRRRRRRAGLPSTKVKSAACGAQCEVARGGGGFAGEPRWASAWLFRNALRSAQQHFSAEPPPQPFGTPPMMSSCQSASGRENPERIRPLDGESAAPSFIHALPRLCCLFTSALRPAPAAPHHGEGARRRSSGVHDPQAGRTPRNKKLPGRAAGDRTDEVAQSRGVIAFIVLFWRVKICGSGRRFKRTSNCPPTPTSICGIFMMRFYWRSGLANFCQRNSEHTKSAGSAP
ncbi:uncharacterized protein LOC143819147 [Paroedura picta]|uniref:uncharacterized protein LOC143819147 n=1 Tax=Paroedura picta TaxID=143630 RepID=UPI0040576799